MIQTLKKKKMAVLGVATLAASAISLGAAPSATAASGTISGTAQLAFTATTSSLEYGLKPTTQIAGTRH
ncbi:MAG: hypothetical protein ACTJG2_00985 [Candidatus Saccharimonadales bacterium]